VSQSSLGKLTRPSDADITITKKIKEAGKIIDIGIIDHIIIGGT
jgi:DNA repair protein RadC